MKLSLVIVCLAAIAAGVVHFRRERTLLRNEIQKLEARQVALRRELWDQQSRLAYLSSPSEVLRRTRDMAIPMTDRMPPAPGPAAPKPPGRRR